MIKVIKSGNKLFKGKCNKCNCEFTYELNDLRDVSDPYVPCPECGHWYIHQAISAEIEDTTESVKPIAQQLTKVQQFINDVNNGKLPEIPRQSLSELHLCNHCIRSFYDFDGDVRCGMNAADCKHQAVVDCKYYMPFSKGV